MTDPRAVGVEWAEVTVSGSSWRLTWDDDELCEHILLFQTDPRSPAGGFWQRVGACDEDGLWSDEILPWLVVEMLLDRNAKREAAP